MMIAVRMIMMMMMTMTTTTMMMVIIIIIIIIIYSQSMLSGKYSAIFSAYKEQDGSPLFT